MSAIRLLYYKIQDILDPVTSLITAIPHALTPQPSIRQQVDDQPFAPSRVKIEGATFGFSNPTNYTPGANCFPAYNIPDMKKRSERLRGYDYANIWHGWWTYNKPGYFSWEIGSLSLQIGIYKIQPGFNRDIFMLENFVEAVQLNLAIRLLISKDSGSKASEYPLPRAPENAYSLVEYGSRRWLRLFLKIKQGPTLYRLEELNIPLNAHYYLNLSFQHAIEDRAEAPALYEQTGARVAKEIMQSLLLEPNAPLPLLESEGLKQAVQDPRLWQARYKEDIPEELLKKR